MSVWKSVKNNTMDKAVNMEMLETALNAMGVSLDYSVNEISNTWGHQSCTAAFVKDGKVLSLGVQQDANGGITLVGDTWGTGLGGDGKQDALMDRIAQNYNSELYQDRLAFMGFSIDDVSVDKETGEILQSNYVSENN